MKKILFVTASMGCGGVEKTLINLLEALSPQNYKIDVLLIKKTGEFLDLIPSEVNIFELEISELMRTLIYDFGNTISEEYKLLSKDKKYFTFFVFFVTKIINKIISLIFHKNFLYWLCSRFINYKKFDYDIVCDYHGYGYFSTYFVSKFDAHSKKYSWIHMENITNSFRDISDSYSKFDKIFGVSKECIENFSEKFPLFNKNKLLVLHNIVFKDLICNLANVPFRLPYQRDNKFLIVSVGRLAIQKGVDFSIKVANLLRQSNLDFIWIIIGDGEEKENLKNMVKEYNLNNYFILHGYEENPYPYIKSADLYVQTSRFEGFVTTITEAIMLGKPILSTKFSGVTEQVTQGINGYISDFDVTKFANKLKDLINDKREIEKLGEGSKRKDLSENATLKILNNLFKED